MPSESVGLGNIKFIPVPKCVVLCEIELNQDWLHIVDAGVKQGYIISPMLFVIIFDWSYSNHQNENIWCRYFWRFSSNCTICRWFVSDRRNRALLTGNAEQTKHFVFNSGHSKSAIRKPWWFTVTRVPMFKHCRLWSNM